MQREREREYFCNDVAEFLRILPESLSRVMSGLCCGQHFLEMTQTLTQRWLSSDFWAIEGCMSQVPTCRVGTPSS
jgi:hypothetical protein